MLMMLVHVALLLNCINGGSTSVRLYQAMGILLMLVFTKYSFQSTVAQFTGTDVNVTLAKVSHILELS